MLRARPAPGRPAPTPLPLPSPKALLTLSAAPASAVLLYLLAQNHVVSQMTRFQSCFLYIPNFCPREWESVEGVICDMSLKKPQALVVHAVARRMRACSWFIFQRGLRGGGGVQTAGGRSSV